MELDHKRDQARCSVICHQTARMQCPNMERMSCPKHLFLAVSFPASRSELQLSDKQRSWTPSPAHSSPPPGVGTLLPGPVCSSSPRLSPAGTAVIFDLGYVYTKSLPRGFSHPFVPLVGPGLLSLPLSCWCFQENPFKLDELNKHGSVLWACCSCRPVSVGGVCVYRESTWKVRASQVRD